MTAISFPPGYDLATAQTCSFLVNVGSAMCADWIAAGEPAPAAFDWQPTDPCPVTSSTFSLDEWTFSPIIWSTFSHLFVDHTEPFGFVAATSTGPAYLVFRGSQTRVDFEMDAEPALVEYAPPTASSDGTPRVERGFSRVFDGLLGALTTQLKQVDGPLVVTGHSLGSTVATLAVPVAVSLGIGVEMYNQASPRVGDKDFVSYYSGLDVPTFRLVNTADVVPKLPRFPAYEPVGVEVSFTASYGSDARNHDPCCCYSYAINNPQAPVNPDFSGCEGTWKPGSATSGP